LREYWYVPEGQLAVQTLLTISNQLSVVGQVVTQERVGDVDAKVRGFDVHFATQEAVAVLAK
jgi:hypothetical protein